MVRMDEIRESLHILEQLIDNIPEGDYAVKTKPIIRVPEGAYWASVEASRGEFGVYLESRGDKMPVPREVPLDWVCRWSMVVDTAFERKTRSPT